MSRYSQEGPENSIRDWSASWDKNVIDEFKPLTKEQIRARVRERALPFAVCFENILGDLNFSVGIRNANAFGAQKVFYTGRRRYDRRGSLCAHHYLDVEYLPSVEALLHLKTNHTFVAVEQTKDAIPLSQHKWQADSLVIFGSENGGISPEILKHCGAVIYLPQKGSIRSVNVSVASGVVMHDFMARYQG